MKTTLKEALNGIEGGTVSHCYLIYGDEEYLVKDALEQIVDHLLPRDDRDFNLFVMDGENEDIDAICESLMTPPLLAGNKVVVVRGTRLFHSRASAGSLIKDITDNLERDGRKAAAAFMAFLDIAGWSFDDLTQDGWKGISDDEWRRLVRGDTPSSREEWLPRIISVCLQQGITQRVTGKDTGRLEETLTGSIPAGNILILTADRVDRQKRLFKVVSKQGSVITFPAAKPRSGTQRDLVMEGIGKVLAKHGKRLSPDAMQELGRRTGYHLRMSQMELEKLITYAGDKDTIDRGDIDAVITKSSEDSIFDLTEAIVTRNTEQALATLRDLLNQGVHYMVILSMLIREIRFLLQGKLLLKEGGLDAFRPAMHYRDFQTMVYPGIKELGTKMGRGSDGLTGQHPYVVYNNLKNSKRYSYAGLLAAMDRLAACDLTLKTKGVNPEILLEHLVMDLCR